MNHSAPFLPPSSSSPVATNSTSRLSRMPARLIASIAISSMTPGPLSSIAPRPQISPPLTVPENGGTCHSLELAGTTSMWLSRMIDLVCLPIPRRRAATIPRPFSGSQVVAGIPSVRNFSLNMRAASSSSPGGLLVFIWMYFESRSVASWVTRSQLIGWGGGASETPRDDARAAASWAWERRRGRSRTARSWRGDMRRRSRLSGSRGGGFRSRLEGTRSRTWRQLVDWSE